MTANPSSPALPRRRVWRRRLAWLAGGLILGLVLLVGAMHGLMVLWVARPPTLDRPPAVTELTTETRGDRVYFGRNWLGRREGLPVLYLTGKPFEMGYANGVLTRELMRQQEDTLVALFQKVAPYRWTQFLLKFAVVYKNRHLPNHILPEYQREILGMTRGCPDAHPELGPYYHRILNYHAAQDISYMLMHSPLIQRGCTAFGAWGTQTAKGHLLTARNFDWEADPVFDRGRLVIYCEPDQGIPFVSLAWAGMAGVVSGLNRAGLSITVNGAPSDLPGDAATPTCLVAREVLQYARTIEEARAIIAKRGVFVSALFLVGSRADRTFVVVEKTPTQTRLRAAGTNETLVCANHFLTPELAALAINQEFRRVETSVPREARMTELLGQAPSPLAPATCAAILRDRGLPGGRFAGNGHRSSLNPLIATHAVIMDLTDGIFWAGAPPHQLGGFVAFALDDLERLLTDRALPADPLLTDGAYERCGQARASLERGWAALKRGDLATAAEAAEAAERANPGFYQNAWLLAEVRLRQQRLREALAACETARAGEPALASERNRLTQLRRQLNPPAPAPGGSSPPP